MWLLNAMKKMTLDEINKALNMTAKKYNQSAKIIDVKRQGKKAIVKLQLVDNRTVTINL